MRNSIEYDITDLDTRGLRKFVTGNVMMIAASVLGEVSMRLGDPAATAASLAALVLVIASIVYQFSGLGKMIPYSERFRSARRFLIAALVGSIVIMIAGFAAALGAAATSMTADNMQALTVGGIWAVYAAELFAFIMNILEIRSLLLGSRDVCAAAGESALAEKMQKTEKLYRVVNIALIALIAAALAAMTMTGSTGDMSGGKGLWQALASLPAPVLVLVILAAVSAVAAFVVYIVMLSRVSGTAKKLSGRAADGSKLGVDPRTGYKGKH